MYFVCMCLLIRLDTLITYGTCCILFIWCCPRIYIHFVVRCRYSPLSLSLTQEITQHKECLQTLELKVDFAREVVKLHWSLQWMILLNVWIKGTNATFFYLTLALVRRISLAFVSQTITLHSTRIIIVLAKIIFWSCHFG